MTFLRSKHKSPPFNVLSSLNNIESVYDFVINENHNYHAFGIEKRRNRFEFYLIFNFLEILMEE